MFALTRSFFKHFNIIGAKKIVCYAEGFVIWRFVVSLRGRRKKGRERGRDKSYPLPLSTLRRLVRCVLQVLL